MKNLRIFIVLGVLICFSCLLSGCVFFHASKIARDLKDDMQLEIEMILQEKLGSYTKATLPDNIYHANPICKIGEGGIETEKKLSYIVQTLGLNGMVRVNIYVKEKIYFTEAELKEIQKIWDNWKMPFFFT